MALSCLAADTHFLVVRISEAAAAQSKIIVGKKICVGQERPGSVRKLRISAIVIERMFCKFEKLATHCNSTILTPELSGDQIAEGGARKIRDYGRVNILDGRFARLTGACRREDNHTLGIVDAWVASSSPGAPSLACEPHDLHPTKGAIPDN
jgi:hypothetical protein